MHNHLSSIQALRAYAALYVYVLHSNIPVITPWESVNNEIKRLTNLGGVGVDIFFVISGFVIAWACVLSRPTPESLREFAIKRFFRVVPLYWFATILAGLLLHGRFSRVEWPMFFKDIVFYPTMTQVTPWLGFPTLHLGWTLNYEIFFYALFALCLIARKWALLLALASLVTLAIGSQIFSTGTITLWAFKAPVYSSAYGSLATNPIILEFGLGCIAAILFHSLRTRLPKMAVAFLLILSVVTYVYCVLILPIEPHNVISVGMPSALLLLALVLSENAGLIKIPKWLVSLGASSYSIYLFHPFVIKIFGYSINSLLIAVITCVAQTALLIWLARLAHKKIELPLIDLARRLLNRRPSINKPNINMGLT